MRSWRRWLFGLQTLAGRRRGWFLPYRYAASLPAAGAAGTYQAIERRLQAVEGDLTGLLAEIAGRHADLGRFGGPAPMPRLDQDWFPTLDAAACYALLRARKPARIIEVGSGHSTRVMARALADGGWGGRLTAIDPAPRATLSGLPIEFHRATVHQVDRAIFRTLGPGDVFFVDSSHLAMPGSDVDLLLNQILPDLPAGVLVHIHDIFLPDDYPADWGWRGYNEQQVVAALLQGALAPIWSSRYAATRLSAQTAAALAGLPIRPLAPATSLWAVKRD